MEVIKIRKCAKLEITTNVIEYSGTNATGSGVNTKQTHMKIWPRYIAVQLCR